MIDEPCKRGEHEKCKGGTWCDCQHKPLTQVITLEGIESQESHGEM